jgi:hypothetical protein
MADSYYQIATTPRIFTSYPLWQYATGNLDLTYTYQDRINPEEAIKLIQLDPSNVLDLNGLPDGYTGLEYRLLPTGQTADMTTIWNFNYFMVLGHNFATSGARWKIHADNDEDPVDENVSMNGIVNYTNWNSSPEFNGWSYAQFTETPPSDSYRLRFGVAPYNPDMDGTPPPFRNTPVQIGSLLWGKYYDFPQNCRVNTKTTFDYGIKQKSTISGKTISTANWTKPTRWGNGEPFGLYEIDTEQKTWQSRTGRRSWEISFDSLGPDDVMNQNNMLNDIGWEAQDNHETYEAQGQTKSFYDINDSSDFFSNVIHRSLGGHLPMVFQVNKDNNSPDQFAIVRIKKNSYRVTQKTPNLYSIKLVLEEQL